VHSAHAHEEYFILRRDSMCAHVMDNRHEPLIPRVHEYDEYHISWSCSTCDVYDEYHRALFRHKLTVTGSVQTVQGRTVPHSRSRH